MAVITPQADDFPRWYQDVVARAEVAEGGPARGTMIIRPWGYAIWELMQAELDRRIKATGVQNAYFPLFIPMSFLQREAEHVEGFAPELAVVTHGGGEELAEPLVVRPTSETVVNHLFARWIQSHRDLPLLINQWANVVRWELRPRLLLRTTEFLWQEGHTAHATREQAHERTLQMLEVYRSFMEETLAIAVVHGEKSPAERFAGAERTFTCEGVMRDGKALQMGTSHDLGHNFAKAFDIGYLDANSQRVLVATTSWGASTRMLGAVIMAHGDDHGLRLPPSIAPHQVVVIPLREGRAADAAAGLAASLRDAAVRVHIDERFHLSFGRRSVDWELKGVPVRIEIGERDLDADTMTVVRRDERSKAPVSSGDVPQAVKALLVDMQTRLHAESLAFRQSRTAAVADLASCVTQTHHGLAMVAWCGSAACEAKLGQAIGGAIRCIVDEEPPTTTCVVDQAPATAAALVGRAY